MKLLKLVPDNTNIRFLRWRLPFYVVSLILMAASWGLVLTKGLNLGVDFIGGQMIRVTFVQSPVAPVAELRANVAQLGYGEPIIQQFGKPNEVSIRMKLPEGVDTDAMWAEVDSGRPLATIKAEHTRYARSHQVWGVPVFIVGDKAVFVRLLERPLGDAKVATETIERILETISWSALNEFKHTSVPN